MANKKHPAHDRAVQLIADGWATSAEISHVTGVSPRLVRLWCERAGVPRSTPARNARIEFVKRLMETTDAQSDA